jgi:hypothetical protein
MKVGLGQGESISASLKSFDANEQISQHQWGDATISHGYYVGVLATEYELLRANGQNTDRTVNELYCAIKALERLDYTAESFFGGSNSLNGFFLRDDVPNSNTLVDYLKLHNSGTFSPSYSISSDYLAGPFKRLAEMSLDQINHLNVGFSLIKKFIPRQLIYPLTGENIYDLANNTMSRIFSFVSSGDKFILAQQNVCIPLTSKCKLLTIYGGQLSGQS